MQKIFRPSCAEAGNPENGLVPREKFRKRKILNAFAAKSGETADISAKHCHFDTKNRIKMTHKASGSADSCGSQAFMPPSNMRENKSYPTGPSALPDISGTEKSFSVNRPAAPSATENSPAEAKTVWMDLGIS